MSNNMLIEVYKKIFNKDFNSSDFNNRLEMQKMVYLLQKLGISVGEYRFIWYKHGPYSQTLQNDILSSSSGTNRKIVFSADALKEFDKLKKIITTKELTYSLTQWMECLGSIEYIKDSLLSSSATDEEILEELKKRKPHLDVAKDNGRALELLRSV